MRCGVQMSQVVLKMQKFRAQRDNENVSPLEFTEFSSSHQASPQMRRGDSKFIDSVKYMKANYIKILSLGN